MIWPSKDFKTEEKIEKMSRMQKYFQIRNQRVRFSIKHITNRKYIFWQKNTKNLNRFLKTSRGFCFFFPLLFL